MVASQTVLTEPLRLVISDAPPPAPVASPKDLRATATADRHRVYVGEPVIVTYRVLSRDMRGFEGWWVEGNDRTNMEVGDTVTIRVGVAKEGGG